MDVFGSLERFLSEDLYPYRVPVTVAAVLLLAAATWLAVRRGWLARLATTARARPVASAVVALTLVLIAVPAGYYLASPLWTRTNLIEESPLAVATSPSANATAAATPPPATVTTAPAEPDTAAAPGDLPRTVLIGGWAGADEFHFARGDALIIETAPGAFVLRMENFSVRNGPDLFVYLSPDPGGYTDAAVELGPLKATDGAFNYEIPAGITPEQMRSAVVWCKQFAVLFGSAALE